MAKTLYIHFAKEVFKDLLKGNFNAYQNLKYYKKWKEALQPGQNSISDEQPWLTFPVILFLEHHLNANSKVFEYGGGGSTLFFVSRAKEVITVEHDEAWFKTLEKKINIENKRANWVGNLVLPERNMTTRDLDPSEPGHYYTSDETFVNCTFKSYATFIDRYPDKYFDVILVDGRSRPSCIWHSIPKLKTGGFLIVDNSDRKYYLSALGKTLKTQLELVFKQPAPSPYVNFFTETGIWRKI